MRLKMLRILLALVLLLAVFTGCTDDKNEESEDGEEYRDRVTQEDEDTTAIADWDGTWNSVVAYTEIEEMGDFASQLSSAYGRQWSDVLASDLVSIQMLDTSIVVYTRPQQPDGIMRGDALYDLLYEYAGEYEDDEGVVWHLFEGATETEYKYLVLQPVIDGDVRTFRFRYSESGFDPILKVQDWLPMMVDATAEHEDISSHF